jgi:cell division septal protein FtsQ
LNVLEIDVENRQHVHDVKHQSDANQRSNRNHRMMFVLLLLVLAIVTAQELPKLWISKTSVSGISSGA